jgi:AP-3 complex subunit beta
MFVWKQEADKLKGMKLLLAMLSKGREIPEFFPDVVKNVVVKSIEVKKMVYIYLVHYADFDENCREIALLSINSFQKDMSGANQLIRGLALRVMTSIRVPDIIQIQLLAARKCAGDSSPYVRKCAANALPKIFCVDPDQLDSLKLILDKLLKDSSTMVLGSAVAAFNEICPTYFEILHRNYRKLCHLLADMDEWTQVTVDTFTAALLFFCFTCILSLFLSVV